MNVAQKQMASVKHARKYKRYLIFVAMCCDKSSYEYSFGVYMNTQLHLHDLVLYIVIAIKFNRACPALQK